MWLVENQVERAFDVEQVFPGNMGVDHGGFGLDVAQQFPDVADVGPFLEQVGGVGMPEGMRGDGFEDAGKLSVALQDAAHAGGL